MGQRYKSVNHSKALDRRSPHHYHESKWCVYEFGMEQVVRLPGKWRSKDPKLTNHSINNLGHKLGEYKAQTQLDAGIEHHRTEA